MDIYDHNQTLSYRIIKTGQHINTESQNNNKKYKSEISLRNYNVSAENFKVGTGTKYKNLFNNQNPIFKNQDPTKDPNQNSAYNRYSLKIRNNTQSTFNQFNKFSTLCNDRITENKCIRAKSKSNHCSSSQFSGQIYGTLPNFKNFINVTKETKINMNGNSTNNIHNNHTNNNHPPADHDYGSGPKRLKSNDGGVVESPPREGNFGSQNSSSGLGDKKMRRYLGVIICIQYSIKKT